MAVKFELEAIAARVILELAAVTFAFESTDPKIGCLGIGAGSR